MILQSARPGRDATGLRVNSRRKGVSFWLETTCAAAQWADCVGRSSHPAWRVAKLHRLRHFRHGGQPVRPDTMRSGQMHGPATPPAFRQGYSLPKPACDRISSRRFLDGFEAKTFENCGATVSPAGGRWREPSATKARQPAILPKCNPKRRNRLGRSGLDEIGAAS